MPLPDVLTDYERNAAGLTTADFVTANGFFRRSVLERVGGFDERFALAWREDSDLWFTLLEQGELLGSAPDAVVVHPVRPAPWGMSLRQQRKGFFDALLFKKHPALYRARVQAHPPEGYYATVSSLLLLLVALIRRQYWQAGIAAAIWFWRTGQFCRRRLQGTSHHPAHIAEMIVTSAAIPPLAVYWRLRGAVAFRVPFL